MHECQLKTDLVYFPEKKQSVWYKFIFAVAISKKVQARKKSSSVFSGKDRSASANQWTEKVHSC